MGKPGSTRAEQVLTWILRGIGTLLIVAFPFALMPAGMMARTHEMLGLGAFPDRVIVSYLTRSITLLYGFHGVLMWVVSFDLRRYAGIALYIALMNILFGAGLLAIDLHAGMPWFWTLGEGPPEMIMGVIMLALLRRARRQWEPQG